MLIPRPLRRRDAHRQPPQPRAGLTATVLLPPRESLRSQPCGGLAVEMPTAVLWRCRATGGGLERVCLRISLRILLQASTPSQSSICSHNGSAPAGTLAGRFRPAETTGQLASFSKTKARAATLLLP
mmetsp:Transcript_63258/g.169114  ORF Transcript_63258/g.169114 Transcript_63258/m.169114 type:complete len:127 (-) Transcript_63258:751-1131(-)